MQVCDHNVLTLKCKFLNVMTLKQLSMTSVWQIPGEHHGMLVTPSGQVEARILIPEGHLKPYIALIGHPHSLQGGTMQNKVVTTLARSFKEHGISSLRFNFRGVGASTGVYDKGIGESDDMCFFAKEIQHLFPRQALLFAGFSFGGFVAYRAAAQIPHQLLLTVGPPVNHFDFSAFAVDPSPWVVIQGDEDEVIPSHLVFDFVTHRAIQCIRFNQTGHFFHGKLTELKSTVATLLNDVLS